MQQIQLLYLPSFLHGRSPLASGPVLQPLCPSTVFKQVSMTPAVAADLLWVQKQASSLHPFIPTAPSKWNMEINCFLHLFKIKQRDARSSLKVKHNNYFLKHWYNFLSFFFLLRNSLLLILSLMKGSEVKVCFITEVANLLEIPVDTSRNGVEVKDLSGFG